MIFTFLFFFRAFFSSNIIFPACGKGVWGPHLIVVPTSCIVNWETELKRFLPGFKVILVQNGTVDYDDRNMYKGLQ